jgi:[acyl-carrier-protein] S-malonyltransferase
MERVVFLFPGQGSQYVGMGRDFYDTYATVRDLFDKSSDAIGMDLKKLCFDGPEFVLLETDNVQPAVTLINIATFYVLREEGIYPSASAGHSLGEYAALLAANVVDSIDLMKLVKYRGTFMKEAADKNMGGMIAVMGLGIDKITRLCNEVKEIGYAEVANINSPGQVIISGEANVLRKVSELAKKEGAKFTIPLKVSGPWHSKFMFEARTKMEETLKEFNFNRPTIPVIANATADYEPEPELIKTNLATQITSPVLWMQSIRKLISDGFNYFVEVGPKRVLSGLMRDINREVKIFNVENLETLQKFLKSECCGK